MSLSWKPVEAVFPVCPRESQIKGRRIRNRRPILLAPLHQPKEGEAAAVSIVANKVGFVSGIADGDILFAYSRNPNASPADLESLLRTGAQEVLRIHWRTFESQFEIAA